MTATPEREALIRNVWRDYRTRKPARWICDYGGEPLRIPLYGRAADVAPIEHQVMPTTAAVNVLCFTSERFEYRNGSPWRRVVCEGVSVEEWPLQ